MNLKIGLITFSALLLFTIIAVVWDLSYYGRVHVEIDPVWAIADADARLGREAFIVHGCGSCHAISGVGAANGRVGPQLTDFRNQIYIAGLLPNRPENLIRWILEPQKISPGTAMPNLPVTEEEARNIAAFLYSLN